MKKILTGALAALTLGGVVLGGATEASARDWDHHGNGGAALAAGIAGLAIGAALASGDHGYYAPAPAYYDYGGARPGLCTDCATPLRHRRYRISAREQLLSASLRRSNGQSRRGCGDRRPRRRDEASAFFRINGE